MKSSTETKASRFRKRFRNAIQRAHDIFSPDVALCVARPATPSDGVRCASVVPAAHMATISAATSQVLMEDPATETDRARALRSFHSAFPRPLASLRLLENLTYETHGRHLLAYEERIRELLFAAPQICGARQFNPQYIAALDTKALRSTAEQAWYDQLETQARSASVEADQLARFELLPSEAALATGPALNQCRKCGSTMVEWHQRQTRSADEGITTFCQCRRCGKRWRQ